MADNMTTHAAFDAPGTPAANDPVYEYLPIVYTEEDKAVIRELALQYMEYAALPIQKEKAGLWAKLNDLERTRPMVWHNEMPWHEMNVEEELTISEVTTPTDVNNNIVGHKFIPVITCEDDLEKIVTPKITLDQEKTQATFEAYQEILGDILPVEIKGIQGFWFAPIDDVVMYMGTGELLYNLADDPDLVHASMKKICDVQMAALDQYEALGCLGTNNLNYRSGSGAYGYSNELPRGTMTGMKCSQMWGHVPVSFLHLFLLRCRKSFVCRTKNHG